MLSGTRRTGLASEQASEGKPLPQAHKRFKVLAQPARCRSIWSSVYPTRSLEQRGSHGHHWKTDIQHTR